MIHVISHCIGGGLEIGDFKFLLIDGFPGGSINEEIGLEENLIGYTEYLVIGFDKPLYSLLMGYFCIVMQVSEVLNHEEEML